MTASLTRTNFELESKGFRPESSAIIWASSTGVFVCSTDGDRITAIRAIRNLDKLRWLAEKGTRNS